MNALDPIYLDTSAVLRATLEAGSTPDLEKAVAAAPALITSRLSVVEASRALLRVRFSQRVPEGRLAEIERDVEALWSRCELWELSPAICEAARLVAPTHALRTLDALHLATFLAARRRLGGLVLVTADERLSRAAGG